jgi:hypothetical protein
MDKVQLRELIQIDGSDHAWFEARGERCNLLVFIDDATGRLVELRFITDESFLPIPLPSHHPVTHLAFDRILRVAV